MSILQCMPLDNMRVYENTNNILLLIEQAPKSKKVYAIFDGDLSYDSIKNAFKLDSKKGYVAYYKGVAKHAKMENKVAIKAQSIIFSTNKIPLRAKRQVEGLYFWIEKNGKIINTVDFLFHPEHFEEKKTKPKREREKKIDTRSAETKYETKQEVKREEPEKKDTITKTEETKL